MRGVEGSVFGLYVGVWGQCPISPRFCGYVTGSTARQRSSEEEVFAGHHKALSANPK